MDSFGDDRPAPEAEPRRRSIVARVADVAVRHGRVTLAAWVGLVVFGIVSYTTLLDREGFPPIETPLVLVSGPYLVDDAERVDSEAAVPLVETYTQIDGVVRVDSLAEGNGYSLLVEFDGVSAADGAALMRIATPGIGFAFGPRIRPVDTTKIVESFEVLVSVSAPGGATIEELQLVAGSVSEQLRLDEAIARAEAQPLLVNGFDEETGEDEIRRAHYARVAFVGSDGFREAVTIGLERNEHIDIDLLEFSERVSAAIDRLDVDPRYDVAVTADFANNVRSQLSGLSRNLLTGLAAATLVTLLLIGWRAALMTSVFMISVMLMSLSGLWLFGFSLNTMTLFGLILTLGLLVDDAIVVSEAVDAELARPGDSADDSEAALVAVSKAVDRVGQASLTGSLTTVLVFAPLLFVGGTLGEFIRAIPAAVVITLVSSYVLSVTVIPALGGGVLASGSKHTSVSARVQARVARGLGALAAYPSRNGVTGWLLGAVLVVGAIETLMAASSIAGGLGRDVFPEAKDTNSIEVSIDFDPGVTVDEALAVADVVDVAIVEELGADLVQAQYTRGDERTAEVLIDLTPLEDRDTKSPAYVEALQARLPDFERARVTVAAVGAGPRPEPLPFAVQITADESTVAAAQRLAEELSVAMVGQPLDKVGGDPSTVTEALISTEAQVARTDGVRHIEVRAAFDTDDTTANLDAAETLVTDLYPSAELVRRGLAGDALRFDFGTESENRDSVGSLLVALFVALFLMIALMLIQLRSVVQPLLIVVAIPFSFLGVAVVLALTDNSLSFFVMVGFVALLGVVVNN
ncbi:MAG: efflux RND transporter permease subunit, partial [Actinomycetota bacterium]|nr:efflux RND transporter permease subunit [Actinomycetota bacterium]